MKKNYFYNLVSSLTNILFPIVSFPYASRVLGPIGIGKVQLAVTFAQYFGIIAAIGIPLYGIQEIARYQNDKVKLSKIFTELISIYIISSVVVSIVYYILISVFPIFQTNYNLYLYAGITVLFGFTTLDWVYAGLEEYRIIALRSASIKVIALVLLFLFVKDANDFVYFLLISIFSMMGNNLISLYYIRKKASIIWNNLQLKKHIKPLVYISGTTMAASMYTYLDTILLGLMANEASVGYYTAAIKLTKIAIPFITAAGFVLIPKFTIQFENNNTQEVQQLLNKSWHYIVFFSIPISVGLFTLADEFIIVFSGHEFEQAIPTMRILSALPFFIGLGYFFAFQILLPLGRQKEMFYSVLVGMTISLALNFTLAPLYQANGTAIASLITEIIVTLMYYHFIIKHFNYSYNWSIIFKSTTSCILFIPIVYCVRLFNFNEVVILVIGIAACSATYFLVQYYLFKDIYLKQLQQSIQHKLFKFF